jgi:hypothetical protein
MKIRSEGAELFGRTGEQVMAKLTVAFRNFGNAPSDNNYERALNKLNNFWSFCEAMK